MPNALNKAFHQGNYTMVIPLEEITDVAWEFGVLSGILRVATVRGIVKLRCIGAKRFRTLIQAQIPASCHEAASRRGSVI